MKTRAELKPNYAPVYAAAMYPELAKIFQRHGYALAVHGSLARDFDLIGIPWAAEISSIGDILEDILKIYAVTLVGDPGKHNHGRIAYTLSCGWAECAIDLSFMPAVPSLGSIILANAITE